jgi:hypothetical protein
MNNFRRGFALKFVGDLEDKTMILSWLYESKINLNKQARHVYMDLEASAFHTSIQWFLRMYPCNFIEVHIQSDSKFVMDLRDWLQQGRKLVA